MKNGGLKLKRLKFVTGYQPLILFSLFVFLLASCASAPRVSFSPEQESRELSILPAGAKVYLWADVVHGRPLLEAISSLYISGDGVSDILDSTHSAAAAFFPAEGEGRRFFLAASGSYPRNRANMALGFNRGWRRQRSVTGNTYWYSEQENIALAVGSNIALVSNIDPYDNFEFEIPPPGFAEFNRGFVLAGWMNDPSPTINNFIATMGVPLQVPAEDFFFGVASAPAIGSEDWELFFRIGTASPTHAQSLLALFSMARFFVSMGPQQPAADPSLMSPMDAARLLFANIPEVEEEALILRIGPLDEVRIALLFSMFQV